MRKSTVVTVDMSLTQKVADLARIDLQAPELEQFTAQLQRILSYVDQISEAKTEGVEPLIHPWTIELDLREDVADPPFLDAEGHPKVLKSANDTLFDGFKVPPIL